MTLKLRNIILLSFSILSLSSLLLCSAVLYYYRSQIPPDSIRAVLPVLSLLAFSAAGCITIFLSFRNTASAEIFFSVLFSFRFLSIC